MSGCSAVEETASQEAHDHEAEESSLTLKRWRIVRRVSAADTGVDWKQLMQ
jgi:hypothetical protein